MLDRGPIAKAGKLPPDWTPAQDDMLRKAGGRYVEIAKLSDDLGIAETVLQARWHRLRVGQGARPYNQSAAPREAAYAALSNTVTRPMRLICTALRRGKGLTAAELGERLHRPPSTILQIVRYNRARIEALGCWRLNVQREAGLNKDDYRITLHYCPAGDR